MLNSKTFRVFISSTFSDFLHERTRLQENVFPRLEKFCLDHGYKFQPIDLRWGITDQMGEAHETMNICLEEIRRCQKVTPQPNFIILLGDRYGWRPIPAEIPAKEFQLFFSCANNRIRNLLQNWYWLDENAQPEVYILQAKINETSSSTDWAITEQELRFFFSQAAKELPIADNEQIKYFASATEQEIWLGALNNNSFSNNAFAFLRHIDNLPPDCAKFRDIKQDSIISPDIEAFSRIAELKQRLKSCLPAERLFEYHTSVVSTQTENRTEYDIAQSHLDKFSEDFFIGLKTAFLKEIEAAEAKTVFLDNDSATQEVFLAEKVKDFIARKDIVDKVLEYAGTGENQPLALNGNPGCGKTALIAKCASEARQKFPDFDIRYLFVGLTANSSSLISMLSTLGCDLNEYLEEGVKNQSRLRKTFYDMLCAATEERPIVVFIDALDQIAGEDEIKELSWLPFELPDHARIIVSTIVSDKTCSSLNEKLEQNQILSIPSLPPQDAKFLISSWLKDSRRTISETQMNKIFEIHSDHGLPLYLKMIYERAKKWRSYQVDLETPEKSVEGAIKQFLNRACSRFGEILVRTCLGYLVCSKNGLSEDEILELLFLDQDFRNWFDKIIFYQLPPSSKKIPITVWSGLYFELEPFLVEKIVDDVTVIGFFHRLFYKAIQKNFLDESSAKVYHQRLASYFALSKDTNQNTKTRNSLRTLSELPYQQTLGECYGDLPDSLGNFAFLEEKLKYQPFSVLEDFARLKKISIKNSLVDQKSLFKQMLELSDFINRHFHFVRDYPQLLTQFAVNQPDDSPVAQACKAQQNRLFMKKALNYVNRPQAKSVCLKTFASPDIDSAALISMALSSDRKRIICCFSEKLKMEYPEGIFSGYEEQWHHSNKNSTCFNIDFETGRLIDSEQLDLNPAIVAFNLTESGKTILCRFEDNLISISGLNDLDKEFRIEWQQAKPVYFRHSPDFGIFAFICSDNSVAVVNCAKNNEILIIPPSAYQVNCLEIDVFAKLLYIGNEDGNLSVFYLENGSKISSLSIVSTPIHCLRLLPGNQVLASGDAEGFIKFYRSPQDSTPFILQAHEAPVVSILQANDNILCTAASDGTIRQWDLKNLKEQFKLNKDFQTGFWGTFTKQNRLWLFWGEEKLSIWDTKSGKMIFETACQPGKHSCAATNDGRIFFIFEKIIRVIDAKKNFESDDFFANAQDISGLSISANENRLVFWTSRKMCILDLNSAELMNNLSFRSLKTSGFSPDDKHLLAQSTTSLSLINIDCPKEEFIEFKFSQFTDSFEDFCFSADGNAVFSWKTGLKGATLTEKQKSVFLTKETILSATAANSSNSLVAINEKGELIHGSFFPFEEKERLCLTDQTLFNAQFSPDGKRLATINAKNLLQFWDLTTHQTTGEYGVEGFFKRIVWSKDNRFCTLEGDDSGEFMIFELPTMKRNFENAYCAHNEDLSYLSEKIILPHSADK